MNELDRRRKALEHELASIEAPEPVLFHPTMAARYREQVTMLIAGLSEAERMLGSKEALRDLIEKIVLTPSDDGAGLDIDLYGAIAGLLHLATGVSEQNSKKASPGKSEAFDIVDKTVLVAGAGSDHNLRPEQVKMVAGGRTHHNLLSEGRSMEPGDVRNVTKQVVVVTETFRALRLLFRAAA